MAPIGTEGSKNLPRGGEMLMFIPLIALVFVSACASSQVITYLPEGWKGAPWRIEAKWHDLGDQLSVIIDETLVLHTGIKLFSNEGNAEATYEGKKIRARVFKSREMFKEKTIVQIFVDAEKAAELEF